MNILRRLPLSRLLLLCGLIIAIGASATALATALGSGPTPPAKPLANAVHDALTGPSVEGVSASIQFTNHLLEGANLASGGGEASQFAASPLLSGATGRLWIAKDGRVRLELQAEKGDTEILYDGHTVRVYDGSSNTLYRYTVPNHEASGSTDGGASSAPGGAAPPADTHHEVPSVAKIEEGISHLSEHAKVSGATPTDVAGQPAYTVRFSPTEGGSLIGGVELSFDAVHGVPLRAAVYSSTSSSPVIELAASEVSYGPVEDSVFEFTTPQGAKIDELGSGAKTSSSPSPGAGSQPGDTASQPGDANHPKVTTHGAGITGITVVEDKSSPGKSAAALPEQLPKVKINGVSAAELSTALGTVLSFERSGVRYVVLGALSPAAIEAFARGL